MCLGFIEFLVLQTYNFIEFRKFWPSFLQFFSANPSIPSSSGTPVVRVFDHSTLSHSSLTLSSFILDFFLLHVLFWIVSIVFSNSWIFSNIWVVALGFTSYIFNLLQSVFKWYYILSHMILKLLPSIYVIHFILV